MAARRGNESDSIARKLIRDLFLWVVAIGVELACRYLLSSFGEDLGLSVGGVQWTHNYMSLLVYVTLLSFLTFTTGEVLSIGLRRLLRELTKLVEEFRAFVRALKSQGDEQ